MGRRTTRTTATRVEVTADGTLRRSRPDTVAVEEPLEIRVEDQVLTTTMRTPGDDFDLTLGWLLGERAISSPADVAGMMHCTDVDATGSPTYNVVQVTLARGVTLAEGVSARRTYTSGACGVCGSDSIENVMRGAGRDLSGDTTTVDPRTLLTLPEAMRAGQKGFDRTGGVHAAALFTPDGDLLCVREDIGRHNAVDKVVGWAARTGRDPAGHVLMVSGRAGFELVQKCVVAGIPVMAAVSAPSSLSIELARQAGLTLVGFLRPPRLTVYSAPERLTPRRHVGGERPTPRCPRGIPTRNTE